MRSVFCEGPCGEQRGKALSGATERSAVANPLSTTKIKERRSVPFLFPCIGASFSWLRLGRLIFARRYCFAINCLCLPKSEKDFLSSPVKFNQSAIVSPCSVCSRLLPPFEIPEKMCCLFLFLWRKKLLIRELLIIFANNI